MTQASRASVSTTATRRNRAENWLYLAVGAYVFTLGFIGFARNFYLRPLGADPLPDAGPIYAGVIVHALACTAWMALAVWQPWLILRGHHQRHRSTGRWGGFLALAMVLSGLYVGFVQAERFANEGGNPGFLIVPLGVMADFAFAFSMAILFRRQPELHKRWMVIAHCTLLEPAAARALSTFEVPVFPLIVLLVSAPILTGLVVDLARKRTPPTLYLLGLVLVVGSGFAKQAIARDAGWISFVENALI